MSTRFKILILLLLVFTGGSLQALEKPGEELEAVGITTKLGEQVDLSLPFKNHAGDEIILSDLLLSDRPLIIVPAYYDCPRLCGLLLGGVRDLLAAIDLELGRDFSVATVSFDSTESPQDASARREMYLSRLAENSGGERNETGWHFLVGEESSVSALMSQIGFHYRRDNGEFAHTAALFVLTAKGSISQYFTGIDFPAWDVKLALVEASKGNIGSALDHVLLYCFRFDPTKGRYTWAAFGLMRAGGVLTLILLLGLIVYLRTREKRLSLSSP